MWLSPKGKHFRKGQLTQEQIDTMATIGHKYSKYDERRVTDPHENKQHRLICHKCNQIEEVEEASKVPIEELWRRSGRKPQELTLTSC
jgi:Fe2+ or Zn2+ uptake regulation protein